MEELNKKEGVKSVDIEKSAEIFVEELEKILKDPETLKLARNLEKKYGSISAEDLFKPFTI